MSEQQQTTTEDKNIDNKVEEQSTSSQGPDLNAIKTGGKFLTTKVGDRKVFCKEDFSDDEKAIYELMSDFAENEILPLAHDQLEEKNEELVRKLLKKMGELGL